MRFRFFPVALIVLGVTLLLVGFGSAMLLLPRGFCRHRHCEPRRDDSPVKVGPG